MKIDIELSAIDLKKLIREELERRLGDLQIGENDIHIFVKSKQNYKAEWEDAHFKAVYSVLK
jgi:hypothetical protein